MDGHTLIPAESSCNSLAGWYVDEYNMAQISLNLTDHEVTPIHVAFEEARKDAAELNLAVAGSEVVGLVPLAALLSAADYYCERENLFIVDERQRVMLAVQRLGLTSVAAFDVDARVIEYAVARQRREAGLVDEPLASKTVRAFVEVLGARTAAPGGGSASALAAAMGSGLGAMVGWMTFGWRKFEALDPTMRRLLPPLHGAMKALIPCVDADTDAFTDYMAAMKMPKGDGPDSAEGAARAAAMQAGLKTAIEVPLNVMRLGDRAWDAMLEMAAVGNFGSKSDLQVGARLLEVGIWGAFMNVRINLKDVADDAYTARVEGEGAALAARAKEMMAKTLAALEEREE